MRREWSLALVSLLVTVGVVYLFDIDLLELLLAAVIVVKTQALALFKSFLAKLYLFFAASKKKLWLYLKTLTLAKLLGVGIKRFIIDNYLSKWLDKNIVAPLKAPLSGFVRYYLALSTKEKLKRALLFLLPASLGLYLLGALGWLEHLVFYAEIKAVVIGFFKLLWLFAGKLLGFFYTLFTQSWLAPLLQLFALSYLLEKMQNLPLIGRPLRLLFEKLDALFGAFFAKIARFWHRYVERHISVRVRRKFHDLARRLETKLETLKHRNETFLMKNFITLYIRPGTVEEYFGNHLAQFLKKEGLSALTTAEQKRRFLNDLNRRTGDNIDIVAFFDIAPYPPVQDVFVIESFASGFLGGNKKRGIRADSIWLLNMRPGSVTFRTPHLARTLKSGQIKLIHLPEQAFETMRLTTENGKTYAAVALQSQNHKE